MKIRNMVAIAAIAFLTACSGSSTSMLKSGDPKICVSNAILSKAYEVVRQNAQAPRGDELITEDYGKTRAAWLAKLSFAATDVTSVSVDRENLSAICSGKLRISAEGVSGEEDVPLEYQVKANLSDDQKPIISVNIPPLQGGLSSMLEKIAKPDLDSAQEKRNDSDDALTKQDEDQVRGAPGALEKLQVRSRANLLQRVFSTSELSLIDRTYLSHMMCAAPDAQNRDAHCRKEVRLNKEAKAGDLCNTAGNEWYHCSREAELQEQRDAINKLSEGNAPGAVH